MSPHRSRFGRAALVLPVVAAFAPAQKEGDPRITDGIRGVFQGRSEVDVRQGAEVLLAVGSAKAIEPLLKVLNGPQPHHRDIVWEVLPKFSDVYARKRVEQELKSNSKSPEVREWCAELLGSYGDAAFAGTLQRALSDQAIGVQRAAVRSLGQLRFSGATAELVRISGRADLHLRTLALEALARIDPKAHEGRFLAGLADRDGGVRCALLGTLAEVYPAHAESRSLAMLTDPDWRPRMQAIDNLGAIQTRAAVEGLIRALGAGRPAGAERARQRLEKLTGQKFWMQAQWQAWWKDHADEFSFAAASRPTDSRPASSRTVSTYNGIEITSDHVAFLIDRSRDMAVTLRAKNCPKEDAAQQELQTVLAGLQGRLTFNLFSYAEEVQALAKKPLPLDKPAQAKALAFVKQHPLEGNKNIWQALAEVVDNPELDTVFLLSSGEPEVGLYVHWNRVTEHLRELNRFHKVVVHTVAYSHSKWFRDQLEKIAEVTGGRFQWFE